MHLRAAWSLFGTCFLLVLFCGVGVAPAGDTTNVVFFLIDDLGWTDLGYMYSYLGRDQRYYETPHIDRLARESVIFTNAYSNGPNCAPSRASLMSGKYTPRHGIHTVGDPRRGNHTQRRLEPAENETVLAQEHVTLAEVLQSGEYVTASMGKWHLGRDPTTQGFDVNVAGREWGSPSGGQYHSPLSYPNLIVPHRGVYLTDALTDRAVDFIREHQENPFFLYLTHYAVHTPIQAKQELTRKYQGKSPTPHHTNPKYAAMIESVDESVGRVLEILQELELSDRTIIVFSSDNGGYSGATSNDPLRGAKGMLYEGGIRVPLLIKWPGITPSGATCDEPVMGTDLYPTLVEMTGIHPPQATRLDGRSLVPLLRDPSAALGRAAIHWHFPCYLQGRGDPHGGPFRTTPAGAIRRGPWKLIEWFETGRLELYNLREDVGEKNDLSQQRPDMVRQLHDQMKDWRIAVDAPVPTTPNPRYEGRPSSP